MSEQQRVRDLTSAPRRLPIEVEGSSAFELILSIWSVFNPGESNTAFDLGPEWQEHIRELTPSDLEEEIKALGGPYCSTWLGISSLLITAPHPHDPDNVFGWLGSIDDQRLRRWILGYSAHEEDEALIEQAAQGDIEAVRSLMGDIADEKMDFVEHLITLVQIEGLPKRLAEVLTRFRQEVFVEYEEEFSGAIARAAAARKAVANRNDAKAVIEDATSGIEFDIPLGVRRVVLIPSVVTRPLSLIDGHRGTLLVYYAIADEFMDSDPEAPPSWLLRTYKALSDEKRLRILRRLSEGETTLDELTEMLDLSKSTVHHHISILRGAGLIRVRMATECEDDVKRKAYALREQSLEDATGFLDTYLRTEQAGEQHA
jgi:DNA-binding transcriptional ArsR family regulator